MPLDELDRAGFFQCPTCGKSRPIGERVAAARLRSAVVERMAQDFPAWDRSTTCRSDVHRYRIRLLRETMESQRGPIDSLESAVLSRMQEKQLVARNLEASQRIQLGARLADAVARFGGSWKFLGLFGGVIILWMITNIFLLVTAFDPFPFILLNLVLSCLAAVQAPIIMFGIQNKIVCMPNMIMR